MVGVLAMAAAAAPPPAKDYEIEVSLSISLRLLGCGREVKGDPSFAFMRGKEGHGETPPQL